MSRCQSCGRVLPLWTPEAVIACLNAWYEREGRAPTTREWEKATYEHPSAGTVRHVFGSWRQALTAAMIPQPEPWTRDKVKQAIFEYVYQHGRPPRARDFRSPDRLNAYPSHDTVCRLFGGWNVALEAAGYSLHRDTGRRPVPPWLPNARTKVSHD